MFLYPSWLSIALPSVQRVSRPEDATSKGQSSFFFSGLGMPHLLNKMLPRSIEDINNNNSFTDLVVVVDSEGESISDLRSEIENRFEEYNTNNSISLTIIIQDICIETWLLGNQKIFSASCDCPVLIEYRKFYDCRSLDPQFLRKAPPDMPKSSLAQFHFDYLRRVLREKRVIYSKRNPGNAHEEHYFGQLVRRCGLGHIESFRVFLDWVKSKKS